MIREVSGIRDNDFLFLPEENPLPIAPLHDRSSILSIETIKNDSFLKRVVKFPIHLLNSIWVRLKSFLGNYLFCCFKSCRDLISWKETEIAFEKIYRTIKNPTQYVSSKDRKSRFQEALSELSEEALVRFKFHIGIKRAEYADSSLTETQKISWYEKNKDSIDFRSDYFENLNSTILEKATESFWKEIKHHV